MVVLALLPNSFPLTFPTKAASYTMYPLPQLRPKAPAQIEYLKESHKKHYITKEKVKIKQT